jgi:hypothetical protein
MIIVDYIHEYPIGFCRIGADCGLIYTGMHWGMCIIIR